jgi:hypothetical protein
MAIDYSGYAQAYGGDRQTGQALGQTLGMGLGAIPTFKERYGRYEKSAMDKYTNPMLKAISDTDIEDIDMSDYKTGPTAFAEYAETLKKGRAGEGGKGGMFARKAERKGLVDAQGFIDRYNATRETMKPDIAKRIMGHAQSNFLGDDQMKKWVASKPGLRKFILDAYEQGNPQYAQLRGWALGDKTWKQWWEQKGLGGKVETVSGIPLAAQMGYRGYRDMKAGKSLVGRYNPRGKESIAKLTPEGTKQAAKRLGWEGKTTALDKKAMKTTASAQSKATRALSKAKKLGKSKKVITGLEKTREAAVIANKAAKAKAAEGPTRVVTNFVKKHGVSGLIRKVSQKVGYRGALKLLGRGALSLGLKGTGIGAIGSLVLDASTIFMLYRIVKDINE